MPNLQLLFNQWYKVKVRENLMSFKEGDKVWLKQDTESPSARNLESYWVFGPKSGRLLNLSKDVTMNSIQFETANGKLVVATPAEQRALAKAFSTKLQPIYDKWVRDAKKANKMGMQRFVKRPSML